MAEPEQMSPDRLELNSELNALRCFILKAQHYCQKYKPLILKLSFGTRLLLVSDDKLEA